LQAERSTFEDFLIVSMTTMLIITMVKSSLALSWTDWSTLYSKVQDCS